MRFNENSNELDFITVTETFFKNCIRKPRLNIGNLPTNSRSGIFRSNIGILNPGKDISDTCQKYDRQFEDL